MYLITVKRLAMAHARLICSASWKFGDRNQLKTASLILSGQDGSWKLVLDPLRSDGPLCPSLPSEAGIHVTWTCSFKMSARFPASHPFTLKCIGQVAHINVGQDRLQQSDQHWSTSGLDALR